MNDKNNNSSDKQNTNHQIQPQIGIVSQYIKDLSFENPNAPKVLENSSPPHVNVNVEVNAKPYENDTFEVNIHIIAEAKENDSITFILDLTYGGIFRIIGVPKDQIQPVLLVECPRLIFPFARRVVADATRDGGYSPLLLNPIDFLSLFRQKIAEQKKNQKE
ncbi:MAG: protein-export chaperone SecB [Alphaproteobacteria bacterium]|nr:protein-export chaperone SecB [Alphaproteobacteria bacterium]|tara:strand:- start:359 stop:844 length:486 start_codon:yes stop_codon:yes gene_type:complete